MPKAEDAHQETRLLQIGLHVRGLYHGIPFVGQVVHAIPGTKQFVIVVNPPIKVFGDLRDALPFSEDATQRGEVTIISE